MVQDVGRTSLIVDEGRLVPPTPTCTRNPHTRLVGRRKTRKVDGVGPWSEYEGPWDVYRQRTTSVVQPPQESYGCLVSSGLEAVDSDTELTYV